MVSLQALCIFEKLSQHRQSINVSMKLSCFPLFVGMPELLTVLKFSCKEIVKGEKMIKLSFSNLSIARPFVFHQSGRFDGIDRQLSLFIAF
jgi:hypothetical protein